MKPFEFVSANRNGVEVEIDNIGEGLCGDYDPTDPEDVNLLRFWISVDGEYVEDASYCTCIKADADQSDIQKCADLILETVYEPLMNGESIKHICEQFSYLTA